MDIKELLDKEGKYVGPTKGVSMLPMLKAGRDTVVIYPKRERLKRYDVALYFSGEKLVLHRVIEVLNDGYLIRGDNCYSDEYVKESRVIGVLTEYFRKNERIKVDDAKYVKYAERRVKNYKVRRIVFKVKRRIVLLGKKILRKN